MDTYPFSMNYQYTGLKGGGKHPPLPPGQPGHPGHPGHGHHGHHDHPFSNIHLKLLEAGTPVQIALWVFFGLFAAGFIGTFLVARRVQNKIRVFHYLSALSLAITATTYFALATGLGRVGPGHHVHHLPPRPPHHPHHGDGEPPVHIPERPEPIVIVLRELFIAQDAAHIFTLPLFVLQFSILSGLAPIHAACAVVAAGFSSAATVAADHFPNHRNHFHVRLPFIGWTVHALLWTLASWFVLFFPGITAARTRKRSTQGLYTLGLLALVVGWIAYPIVWFLGTGTNVLGVNAQIITQGLIDISTQLGLVFFILFTHVHDPEDPVWSFPDWIVNPRAGTGADGRGTYAAVASGDNDNAAA